MSAVYSVYTSPFHPPIPNHLPTLIVTPHGSPQNILYSYLHTNFNTENYLLTPSPQGELCVAKLFPPKQSPNNSKSATVSDPGHGSGSSHRVVRCEASRNLKWTINNTGVMSPIYKLSLPSPDNTDLPLFQISKPNPNAAFWSMFYFAYAGHNIPPKRIEFGKIQKNPPGPGGGGTRISITGKTSEEKAVWQTLGEGNEDCVEWVVLCAALNLLDDEILKAAEKNPSVLGAAPPSRPGPVQSQGISLRDPGPAPPPGPGPGPTAHGLQQPHQQQQPIGQRPMQQLPQTGVPFQQRLLPPGQGPISSPGSVPPQAHPQQSNPAGIPRYTPNGLQPPIGPGHPPSNASSPHSHMNGPPQSLNPPSSQGFNSPSPQGLPFNSPSGQGPSHYVGPAPIDTQPSPQFAGSFVSQGRPTGNYPGPVQPRRF